MESRRRYTLAFVVAVAVVVPGRYRVPVLPPAEMVMPPGGFANATGGVGRAENLIATGNFPSCKHAIAILLAHRIAVQPQRNYLVLGDPSYQVILHAMSN